VGFKGFKGGFKGFNLILGFLDLDFRIQRARISLDTKFQVIISFTFHEMICG